MKNQLVKKINKLKREKNALILVHNYQKPEIYAVADFIGDSLDLSKKSSTSDSDYIVFCGVDFMAETAAILNPEKKILLPALDACCPMAAMINVTGLERLKNKYPEAAVVSYVNTSAAVKAESDICCTSANAVKIVNSLRERDVIFVPDENLALYVKRYTNKNIIPWKGWCYVHSKFSGNRLKEAKVLHPNAEVIVHPECKPEVIDLADYACSTSQMITRVGESDNHEFIIGTEIGMIKKLELVYQDKIFYTIPPGSTCIQMKKNNLNLILKSLKEEIHVITVPEPIQKRARKAIDRMLK